MSYSDGQQYLPPSEQYLTASILATHEQMYTQNQVAPSVPRHNVPQQRKRPKYTRSKTGCLTCRVKKIKCDETKPSCVRCTHGQRECAWPESAPARRKPQTRKNSTDERPSTAGSSISDESSPSIRGLTPPRRIEPDLGVPPHLASRRNMDHYVQLPPVNVADHRRPILARPSYVQSHSAETIQHHQSNFDQSTYSRYERSYGQHHSYNGHGAAQYSQDHHVSQSSTLRAPPMDRMTHSQSLHQWGPSTSLPALEAYQDYPLQERGMVGTSEAHYRYQ